MKFIKNQQENLKKDSVLAWNVKINALEIVQVTVWVLTGLVQLIIMDA
ncbi:hypothetical protein LEQ06_09015 [Paraclostridium sp. AKS46]|nr:hypothetical protein [Paraclostridium sp. AKS46]